MFEITKKFCDSFLDIGVPGFDLAVFKKGECILRYMNGYSDFENKIAMKGDEKYNIYSCSKVITCTAALQLWEKGLFSLEDKLSDYMPEFKNMKVKTENGIKDAEKPILIRHLFEMTAGFSYDILSESFFECKKETNNECPTRIAISYLAKEPLLFEPGERWEYSLCHDVLAGLVEVVSGEKFEDYVRKNIFDVLGMSDSTFMLPESEIESIAQQYKFENGKLVNIGKNIFGFKIGTKYASGGAGAISTVNDYIKFLEGLRKGQLIKIETLKLMITDRLSEYQKSKYWTKDVYGYGYGLGVRCPMGDYKKNDFGWAGAAGAYLAADYENEISIYFACHLHSSPAQDISTMLYRIVMAEIFDINEIRNIENELKELYGFFL